MNRSIILLVGFILISTGVLVTVYQFLFEKESVSREAVLEKILQGEEYLRQSNESSKEKAISIFSELSAKSVPEFQFRIRFNLAKALEKNGESYRALEMYQSLNKNLTSEDEESLSLALGNLLLRLDRESEGRAHLDTVLRKSTDRKSRALAHYYLGNYYFSKNQWESARKNYALAIQEDPNLTDARLGLGRSLHKLGKDQAFFDIFDGYLEESSKMDGTNPKVEIEYKSEILKQARDFYTNKKYWKAIEYFQKALTLNLSGKEEEYVLFTIAASYESLNRYRDAIQYYNQVLTNSTYSLDQEAIFRKGRIYFLQGQYERAASVFQVAIEKYPKNHITEKAIAWKKESLDQIRDTIEFREPGADRSRVNRTLEDEMPDLEF